MLNRYQLELKANNNLKKIRLHLLLLPFLLLTGIIIFLVLTNSFSVDGYIKIQEELFFSLNAKLAKFPNLQFNITQLGDALIFFSLLTIFIIYVPKLWGAIITSGLLSLIISFSLKKLFAIPRPAAVFDNDRFVIIGKTLSGSTSLPSGHSITAFTTITLVLFAFLPKELKTKIIWFFAVLILGLFIAFSRVGVGAHFPIDVISGSIIGYISAVLGIFINNKVNWWNWIGQKKYYPFFLVLFLVFGIAIVKKITEYNLMIFYISLFSLIVTSYLMITTTYAKKES